MVRWERGSVILKNNKEIGGLKLSFSRWPSNFLGFGEKGVVLVQIFGVDNGFSASPLAFDC